jgi:alanyl-tRNA synthetase
MPTDKEIKKEFKLKASQNPDDFYATAALKREGFSRGKCVRCGIFFWSVVGSQKTCGDPSCSGGFRFIGNTPAKNKLDYIGVWKKFSELFSKWGYTPIKRYPVVARWRDDTDFVQASIYDFQPYVVSGEVAPPANPLVVPQPCLRFNDIDNIGITGAHYSCFIMIGQHAFMAPKDWSQERYFTDIHNWLKQGLGLPNEEITFHEDAWAGGGNFGPCMEYFSRGLELGNQVYMLYEVTPSGNKELNLKVLDMGMGHERNAWFSQGKSTSYETTFPTVVEFLKKNTGVRVDPVLMEKFLPYASYLNVDEVEDINKTWIEVASKVGVSAPELRKAVSESAALYSIAEHSRALLFALADGGMPSNVGGGYNLRVLYRRALSLMDTHKWNVDMNTIAKLHAEYLKPIFPELYQNLEQVHRILDVEKAKYEATKQKTKSIIAKMMNEDVTEEKLTMYDSQGIAPELLAQEASAIGKKITVPDNFYARVSELHEKNKQVHATKKEEKLSLTGVADTQALYFGDYLLTENVGRVLKIIDNNVVLDKTVAYPTSGGQLHDIGDINGQEIVDIFKQGGVIVHVLKDAPMFKEGDSVTVRIDAERRKQLAQHHTSTHIIGAAARKILGNHINQAGAKKTKEKGTLDITHYQSLSDEETSRIEKEANNLVESHIPVIKQFHSRTDAEQKYGMAIYQGGAVPGKNLRIVEVKGIDVQACGGTHLNNTSETGHIHILKSTKISDSIVRIEFTAGKAAEREKHGQSAIIEEAAQLLGCTAAQVPARAEELFTKWKDAVKKGKTVDKKLTSALEYHGPDMLKKVSDVLKTQPEHIIKTLKRFIDELNAA